MEENDIRKIIEEFGASIYFDKEMAHEDIMGSLAQVAMLNKISVLTDEEAATLKRGLSDLAKQVEEGSFIFDPTYEDIHMNIEKALFAVVGEVAGKLHTGRSRNDQVALDMRLYLRNQVLKIVSGLIKLQKALLEQAKKHSNTILPGYTHLQRAQPVLLAHHLMAYAWMFNRDSNRLIDAWKRLNTLPLGSGALAGSTFPLDREYVADLLAFDSICENSMDGVSDRDFILEFLACASIFMVHISRISEEFILWSSDEFGFLDLDRRFCSGSSIMPQKINPDMAELSRGKAGRIFGNLMGMLTVIKGLPLAYNKDLQEDKEGMFDTVKTINQVLKVFTPMIATATFNTERMRQAADLSYANATDLADYLAKKGIPFREAHGIVKKLVISAHESGRALEDLPLSELQEFSPVIADDVYQILKTEAVVAARDTHGGTAPTQVKLQAERLAAAITELEDWLNTTSATLKV